MNVIIANFLILTANIVNKDLIQRFDFLPKSSSGINWGQTFRGDINNTM